MATLSRDTSEQTERMMLDLLRKKTPGERMLMAWDTTHCLRQLVKSSLRRRYPQADEQELRCRFAARWLGREWAIRLYGWDPEQNGW
jgi:hypothetical protein